MFIILLVCWSINCSSLVQCSCIALEAFGPISRDYFSVKIRPRTYSVWCCSKRHEMLFYIRQADSTWWRHQKEIYSALLAICAGNSPVPGEFQAQRPVTRSFDVFFDLRLNKRLSKQSLGLWFETLSCPLWRLCNDMRSKQTQVIISEAKSGVFLLLVSA